MADPVSVMEHCLEREGVSVRMQRHIETLTTELDAHMADMDRRIVDRLEEILSDAHVNTHTRTHTDTHTSVPNLQQHCL